MGVAVKKWLVLAALLIVSSLGKADVATKIVCAGDLVGLEKKVKALTRGGCRLAGEAQEIKGFASELYCQALEFPLPPKFPELKNED